MAQFTRSLRFKILTTTLVGALTLVLAVNVPTRVQAQSGSDSFSSGTPLEELRPLHSSATPIIAQGEATRNRSEIRLPTQWENFRVPNNPGPAEPDNTQSGAKRSPECIQGNQSLTPLVPPSGIGTTAAEYPTVFWYMPPTRALAVDFMLRDANGEDIYSVQYALVKSPFSPTVPLEQQDTSASEEPEGEAVSNSGIMSLTLPAFSNFPPLEIDQEYRWQLALICESPIERGGDIVVEGGVKRVELNPAFALRIQQASPEERVTLYADQRLWYETLATLVELRRDRPNDTELAAALNQLLNSAGLDRIAQEPTN